MDLSEPLAIDWATSWEQASLALTALGALFGPVLAVMVAHRLNRRDVPRPRPKTRLRPPKVIGPGRIAVLVIIVVVSVAIAIKDGTPTNLERWIALNFVAIAAVIGYGLARSQRWRRSTLRLSQDVMDLQPRSDGSGGGLRYVTAIPTDLSSVYTPQDLDRSKLRLEHNELEHEDKPEEQRVSIG